MQGVEILTSAQVATEYAANWSAFWIAFEIAFGIMFIVGIVISIKDYDWIHIVFGSIAGIIGGSVLGLYACFIFDKPVAYETQYQVTVSDDVSLTEFYEHYEVIDNDGKIFTVREK